MRTLVRRAALTKLGSERTRFAAARRAPAKQWRPSLSARSLFMHRFAERLFGIQNFEFCTTFSPLNVPIRMSFSLYSRDLKCLRAPLNAS